MAYAIPARLESPLWEVIDADAGPMSSVVHVPKTTCPGPWLWVPRPATLRRLAS